ncbi:GNAT family N-acetyltransferase [Filimonas effusa]|uniref:N-acetyltransferase n=1 Tax=Filimonas effusa TaxID=2508721 RepID=A0A4Q1DCV3_9BACT|nr:GNAT family N-acetyltransferase [Filimonas effusa]RXK87307.1 N-acetyltransferase [Filimonas effusa]
MALMLETSQLLIREFAITDAAFAFRLLNTPSWIRFIGDKGIYSISEAQDYIVQRFHKGYEETGYGAWLVLLKETNQPVGLCGLFQRTYLEHPDIGFAFLPQFEGKGYAYEATTATIAYAEEQLRLPCLLAITHDDNDRSVRLLERAGFAYKETMLPPDENKPLLVFRRALPGYVVQ